MSRRLTLKSASLAAVLALVASSVQAADISVGVLVPLTGSQAADGQEMRNAIVMAADKINSPGSLFGGRVILDVEDDACDPQVAVNAASKLVSQAVTAVVGGYCSGATLPTLKVFGDAHIPFIIAAANSTKLIDAKPASAFMIDSTGSDQVKTAVALLQSKGYKQLAIVDEGDAYSSDLARLAEEAWPAAGGKIVAHEVATNGQQDFSALVTRILGQRPDAIFWTAYFGDGALLVKQLRQAGYRGAIVLGDANNSPKLIEIAGRAAQGAYLLATPTVEDLPGASTFVADYRKRFGAAPGPYSALAYDSLLLFADASKRAGSTASAGLVTALQSTKKFEGVAGPITFTSANTLDHSNFVVMVADNGKWTLDRAVK